jgi:hypothetical protein
VRCVTAYAVFCTLAALDPLAAQQPQVVRSTGPGTWGIGLRLVEELRIGRLDGADEYVLGEVEGVAVGRDGRIYVADAQVPVVRMYDASGRFVRNLGRAGAGPGEYDELAGLRTLPDGRVAIWDHDNSRITVFSADGDLAATHRVPSALAGSETFQVDQAGNFYVRAVVRFDETSHRLADATQGWIRVAPDGQIRDTVVIPLDARRPESFVLSTPSGFDRPFTTELVSTLGRNGTLITGRNDTYAFVQHRTAGPPLRVERASTPVRLGREERAEWLAWARMFEQRAANPTSSNPRAILTPPRQVRYEIPETKPAFRELATDSQARIWVRRYVEAQKRPASEPATVDRPPRTWIEPPTYDVFEADGRFLGTVTLPWEARFYDARDRNVWATVTGALDETYVVRYRIEGAR